MSKLIVEVSPELHRAVKERALREHCTVKDLVTKILQEHLRASSDARPDAATGLCGSWSDDRAASRIVTEIRAARHRRS
jgi:hypothetical protein